MLCSIIERDNWYIDVSNTFLLSVKKFRNIFWKLLKTIRPISPAPNRVDLDEFNLAFMHNNRN